MEFRALGKTGVRVSALGLGGHEFHPDGRLKGFSDSKTATRAGYVNDDFPGKDRKALVQLAVQQGISYFDATIDPELKALGGCLRASAAPDSVLVQCRPQEMCYRYEAGNRGLADASRLRAEVERLIELLGRERIDVLNFGFEADALDADPSSLERVAKNIRALKDSGLIRFAACDSLHSGEAHYLAMMGTGAFDVVWINFGPLWPHAAEQIFPVAAELGMSVAVREAFSKGKLFQLAESCGLRADRPKLARAAIRWILSHPEVSTLVLGVRNVRELEMNLAAANGAMTGEDSMILDELRARPEFAGAVRPI